MPPDLGCWEWSGCGLRPIPPVRVATSVAACHRCVKTATGLVVSWGALLTPGCHRRPPLDDDGRPHHTNVYINFWCWRGQAHGRLYWAGCGSICGPCPRHWQGQASGLGLWCGGESDAIRCSGDVMASSLVGFVRFGEVRSVGRPFASPAVARHVRTTITNGATRPVGIGCTAVGEKCDHILGVGSARLLVVTGIPAADAFAPVPR